MHGAQLTDLQADLKSLIEMEPYAHRARKLQASQLEDKQQPNSKNGGNIPRALQPPPPNPAGIRDKKASKMTNKEVESWINDTLEVQLSELKEE